MSETKKTLYKRETAISALMDLANKLTEYSSKITRVPFYDEIKDVIIFGSFAKGAEKVHDIDVYLEIEEHREIATSDVHYFIMKDGEVDYDELEKMFI